MSPEPNFYEEESERWECCGQAMKKNFRRGNRCKIIFKCTAGDQNPCFHRIECSDKYCHFLINGKCTSRAANVERLILKKGELLEG